MLCIFLFLTFAVYDTNSQASQWVDTFQKTLCHDRWAQMDWQSILRPCRYNLEFGKNKYEEKQKTSPKWSHTLGLHFKKTGEFSRIGIKAELVMDIIKTLAVTHGVFLYVAQIE